jgi:pimeloyl-ACP methyl ester carboxylesterase
MIDRRQIFIAVEAPATATAPTWYVSAWISVPEELRRPELLILVHGANSDHRYWDFPFEPDSYSFAKWAHARGFATLMIDRIGSGASSLPPGAENTIDAQAEVLHRIVEKARVGSDGIPAFSRVISIGASFGSVVCGAESARYGDVDAVVLSAYMPVDGTGPLSEEILRSLFEPAVRRRPQLAGLVDEDYLLPREDLGPDWLYRLDSADRAIIAANESISGTMTLGELSGVSEAGPFIRSSSAPTLVLVGQFDPLLFDSGIEEDCYSSSAHTAELSPPNFEYRVVPDTGHGLALHRTAQHSFQMIGDWLDEQRKETNDA